MQEEAEDGTRLDFRSAVETVRTAEQYLVSKKTKRKKRTKQKDLRKGIMQVGVVQKVFESDVAVVAPEAVARVALRSVEPHSWGVVEVTVANAKDGGHLKPELFVNMLSDLSGTTFRLSHVHRYVPYFHVSVLHWSRSVSTCKLGLRFTAKIGLSLRLSNQTPWDMAVPHHHVEEA